ncbi:hypothetical protein MCEMRE249_00038 [Candidatus Nanopelagicaceae bacterium]
MKDSSIRTKSVSTSVHLAGKILQNLTAIWMGSPENEVYGNSAVLNHFAGVNGKRLQGRFQHGWPAHTPNGLYYKNDFLFTYVWRLSTEQAAHRMGWNNFRAIGAPWLYLLKILEADGWNISNQEPKDSRGALLWVYGKHSLEVSNTDNSRLMHFLAEANANSSYGDICLLYFEDFDSLSNHDFSHFPNLQIVTLGQRSSSFISDSHLTRLFHILKATRELRIDHPSTLVLYALTLDVRINWVRNSQWEEAVALAWKLEMNDLVDLMTATPDTSCLFRSFAFEHLGEESLKSREDLKNILLMGGGYQSLVRFVVLPLLTLLNFPLRVFRKFLSSN